MILILQPLTRAAQSIPDNPIPGVSNGHAHGLTRSPLAAPESDDEVTATVSMGPQDPSLQHSGRSTPAFGSEGAVGLALECLLACMALLVPRERQSLGRCRAGLGECPGLGVTDERAIDCSGSGLGKGPW